MPRKLNIVTRLQHWMDSVPGQTFLNYAYSWGAAIVILGALFKLTHLKGGNLMLFLGMGTEAVVFFLAAFDRPFDKNEIGKELPHDFESDEEIERAEGLTPEEQLAAAVETPALAEETPAAVAQTVPVQQPTMAPAAAYVAQPVSGVAFVAPQGGVSAPEGAGSQTTAAQSAENVSESASPTQASAAPFVAAHYETPEGQRAIEEGAQRLAEIVRLANDELLRRTQAVLSPDMEAATEEYIEKLRTLNETLAKVDEQSARLTRDSQEMENLNRTLIGINKVYDLHFASISRQVTTIEEINAQTRDLAAKIEEVNQIYARMVQTLNIMGNPYAAMGGVNAQPAAAPAQQSPEAPTQPTSAS
ncbi:MAG: gliding motility protein GldL [Prevotellaceae bacterium]|nr:gliding motility protein GldL [Prevotellaceae bacterium]